MSQSWTSASLKVTSTPRSFASATALACAAGREVDRGDVEPLLGEPHAVAALAVGDRERLAALRQQRPAGRRESSWVPGRRRSRLPRNDLPIADIRSNRFSISGRLHICGGAAARQARDAEDHGCARRSDLSAATSLVVAPSPATAQPAASRTSPCRWCRGRACPRWPGSDRGGRSSRA